MTNPHDGHRKRMRERFRKEGLEHFAPHEVLELVLFYGRARGDVNPTAHALLDQFGSLKGVLEAKPEQLMAVPGVGEETATLLSLLLPLWRRYGACVAEESKRIENRRQAQAYCEALMAGMRSERLYVIALSTEDNLLGCRMVAEGTLGEVQAYPRTVVQIALDLNAAKLILCHNHPGGVPEPSREDVETTLLLQDLLTPMGILLLDHIIVADSGSYSMTLHGDLNGQRTAKPKR